MSRALLYEMTGKVLNERLLLAKARESSDVALKRAEGGYLYCWPGLVIQTREDGTDRKQLRRGAMDLVTRCAGRDWARSVAAATAEGARQHHSRAWSGKEPCLKWSDH